MEFLVSMGFSEEDASNAMSTSNNNIDLALNKLLSAPADTSSASAFDDQDLNREFLDNNDVSSGRKVVTVLPLSQYSIGGPSSCTSISCTAIAEILKKLALEEDITDVGWLTELLLSGNEMHHRIMTKCSSSGSLVDHLSVDEFYLYRQNLNTMPSDNEKRTIQVLNKDIPVQGVVGTSSNVFTEAIESCIELAKQSQQSMQQSVQQSAVVSLQTTTPPTHIGIVLTKPPETLCIAVRIDDVGGTSGSNSSNSSSNNDLPLSYYLFDSHSRPQLGLDGGYLIAATHLHHITNHLNTLYPSMDLGATGDMDNVQSIMYNSFECTVVSKDTTV